jgi:acyl dehydratase
MAIHRSSVPKPYTWENIEIGEEFGPVEGIISDFQVKMHAYAVDDYSPWYFQDSPFGGRIGHPMLVANEIVGLFQLVYDTNPSYAAGLHARNEIEFLQPLFVGQKVTLKARHTEKYQKRGQNYRILEGESLDEAGQPFLRLRATETVGLSAGTPVGRTTGIPPPDAITGEVPPGAPTVHQGSKWVPVGAVLASLTKHTTLEQSIAYSGFRYGWAEDGAKAMRFSMHTDPEDARRRGQPDAIVQGLCSATYLSELCTSFFGPAWLTTGRLSTTFIRPVIVRDTLTATGRVKRLEAEGDRNRLWLDVWCKNQRGELVTVGRASAEVE